MLLQVEKIKNKNLYIILIITIVFFGIFIKMDFTTDTYSVLNSMPKEIFMHFMLSGRFITAFCWGVVNVLNLSDNIIYIISYLMAILCITFAIYELFELINAKVKNNLVSLLISVITIINPFSIELFMYIEKGILTLAVLLSVLAVKSFVKYLEGNKKSLIWMVLLMLVAVFCYQGVVGIFIAISAVFIILYSKNIKDFIRNNFIILLGYGIPAIINFLTVRTFFVNDRVNGEIILGESINKILQGTESMLSTYGILPEGIFLILLSLIILLAFLTIVLNKEKISKKIIMILSLLYIIIIALAITIAPQIMQNTASIWFVPRSTYCFASIIGIVAMYIVLCAKEYKIKSKIEIAKITISILAIILLIIQFYKFNQIEIDHYNVNYLDKVNSLQIGKKILEYEENTGSKITNIAIYEDSNVSYTYPGIIAIGDMNITGFFPDWSIIKMINYYNNLNLVQVDKNEKIAENFKNEDWNNFNENQIIIEGDTIHYCKF